MCMKPAVAMFRRIVTDVFGIAASGSTAFGTPARIHTGSLPDIRVLFTTCSDNRGGGGKPLSKPRATADPTCSCRPRAPFPSRRSRLGAPF